MNVKQQFDNLQAKVDKLNDVLITYYYHFGLQCRLYRIRKNGQTLDEDLTYDEANKILDNL